MPAYLRSTRRSGPALPKQSWPQVELNRTDASPHTIDELICRRAVGPGCDDPIFAYASSGTEYMDYTPKQLNEFAIKAANFYATDIVPRQTSGSPVEVIALLGTSRLEYLATLLGISKLGHTVLFLSTRISEEAYTSLLTVTNATTILIDPAYAKVAAAVKSKLPDLEVRPLCTEPQLLAASSYPLQVCLDRDIEQSKVAWIIHSSGSTSLPKPIYQTHKAALGNYSINFGLRGFITLPLFHAHGLSCTFRAIHAKKKIYMYNASLPLANQHLIRTLKEHRDIGIFYGVPYALKLLGESEEGIKLLAGLEIVMFGGSACPKMLGDRLVAAGVQLVSHYGTTETGQLMTSFRARDDKDWDYVRPSEKLLPFLQMEPQGEVGLYELCVKEGWPSKVMSNRDDGTYATKDLFEAHPTTPNAWRYYARKDDTIVLVNGEKANPLLVEGIAREDYRVAEAIVFGSNKPRLGMFIIPSEAGVAFAEDDMINAIWPAIRDANIYMPAHGQLSKDMIKVLPYDANYRRTDKGTVIRAAFYNDFEKEIENVYRAVEKFEGTMLLSREQLMLWLKSVIGDLIGLEDASVLQDTTDLFAMGVDSLQSTRIRTAIGNSISLGGKPLGQNIVFDFPTTAKLADEILRLQSDGEVRSVPSIEDRMKDMIKRHSCFEPHISLEGNPEGGESVVVTGSTGSLGAHIAAHLASLSTVKTVYCLIRASTKEVAAQRLGKSLHDRGIYDSVAPDSFKKVITIPSNFGDPKLGIGDDTYSELTNTISIVVHCAWSVNFNLALESFEQDCVGGTKNLIDLCLRAKRPKPASFNFCSSISTVVRTPVGETVPEALPASLSYAQSMGYAQSKLVTEHLCRVATEKTGITTRVLRIGQIIGDTRYGIWNPTEAIPLMLQTVDTIGALPLLDENSSWLPVDTVAQAISDVVLSSAEEPVVNIINHNTFHWTNELLPLIRATGLNFEGIDQRDWVRRLRTSNPDPEINPPIKLVEFFAQKYDQVGSTLNRDYTSDIAQSLSPALSHAKAIDANHVSKFMAHLRSFWTSQQSAKSS
ncbi:acetyl-CoA synthetase-like protein [Viridothelium virens]|uniref:Acetyl-CoA synthetase-like protein n=1 Tax=Viridothelium virens TaxID=1048519 RepID=A0A6A6GZY2_VIRVR|nr:acetyl-CoA synthetase-like protein [Viridothelium virens]